MSRRWTIALLALAACTPLKHGSRQITVPAGTSLAVEMRETISSAGNQPGDPFTTVVVQPISVGGRVAIDAGSVVTGRVAIAVPSKRIGERAHLYLEFTTLGFPSGKSAPLAALFHERAALGTAISLNEGSTIWIRLDAPLTLPTRA